MKTPFEFAQCVSLDKGKPRETGGHKAAGLKTGVVDTSCSRQPGCRSVCNKLWWPGFFYGAAEMIALNSMNRQIQRREGGAVNMRLLFQSMFQRSMLQSKRKSMRGVWGREWGFTMVEMIVAMFIFGILATGITTLMGVLIQNNDFSQCMTEATSLAESKMEIFRNMGYSNIPVGYGSDDPSPDYSRWWNVEENVPQADMKQIIVTVSWYDHKEQRHYVKIYTILHQ